MQTLYTHKDANIRKTWLLITFFILLFVGLGYALNYLFGGSSYAILIFAVGISLALGFGSYWWSDKLVLKMSRAVPVKKEEHKELYNIVENLSITAGLPMPKLYILHEQAPNAFATGRDPEHGVVAVTTGLLDILDKNELEGVIAHELSHIGNRDILISTVVVVLAGSIVYIADILFHSLIWGGSSNNDRGGAFSILAGLAIVIVVSILATIVRMSISRKREFLADASGALLTRYPEGLASALRKISNDSRKLSVANNATAHLFFENPFGGDKKGKKVDFFSQLFMTHPPVDQRIKALMGETESTQTQEQEDATRE